VKMKPESISTVGSSPNQALIRVMFNNHCGPFFHDPDMTQLLLLGKFEYTGGPIFKVVLEC